ncbi:hypothetical protein [Micromonospora sp. NBC_00421]|uniref:hypothetical protein n=1 Tax=Micromonospora sp. NBC_00421 TaxID=2975976 RepID=UPI002E24B38D
MPGRSLLRTAAVALAAALAVGGCTSTGTSAGDPTTEAGATDAAPGPVAATTPAGTGSITDTDATGGGSTGGGSTGGGSTGGGSTGGGTGSSGGGRSGTKSSGPTISYFRVADKPSCPAGTNVNPIAGSPALVEWKAGNVDSVALSVDGPGIYGDDYPPAGSETFNFPCSGREGEVQKHTYTLTVRNAHGTQTKTIVVTAPVHDIPKV